MRREARALEAVPAAAVRNRVPARGLFCSSPERRLISARGSKDSAATGARTKLGALELRVRAALQRHLAAWHEADADETVIQCRGKAVSTSRRVDASSGPTHGLDAQVNPWNARLTVVRWLIGGSPMGGGRPLCIGYLDDRSPSFTRRPTRRIWPPAGTPWTSYYVRFNFPDETHGIPKIQVIQWLGRVAQRESTTLTS
jgi:hypothetical protein